jgi:hypothetical protein
VPLTLAVGRFFMTQIAEIIKNKVTDMLFHNVSPEYKRGVIDCANMAIREIKQRPTRRATDVCHLCGTKYAMRDNYCRQCGTRR